MQNYPITVGIDVSKNHLDIAVFHHLEKQESIQIKNTAQKLEAYFSNFIKKYEVSQSLFCLEATGLYMNFLLTILVNQKANIWVENPVQIKRSLGLQRGKNDQVDAQRIAQYAYRFQDQVQLYQPPSQVIEKIQHLHQLRNKLVQTRKQLQTAFQEKQKFLAKEISQNLKEHTQPILEKLSTQITKIEKDLQRLIKEDEQLKTKLETLQSVTGVGPVTARAILIATKGFSKFKSARQFACYCGVAPFENSSGKFKGKTKVSKMANKKLKALLHICALSAIRVEGELKEYYHRKVKQTKNACFKCC